MTYDPFRLSVWNKACLKLLRAIKVEGAVSETTGLLNVFIPFKGGFS